MSKLAINAASMNKLIAIIYSLYFALHVTGCSTTPGDKEEGRLVATMSVYKTSKGFVIVSDHSGDRMVVQFNIGKIYNFPKLEK